MKTFSTAALMLGVALGVSATIIVMTGVWGLSPYLGAHGFHPLGIIVFCVAVGCVGSVILLLLSKSIVQRSLRLEIVDPVGARAELGWLVETAKRLADRAGLVRVPDIGVYSSPDLNAFAVGAHCEDAVIAISTGLLSSLKREEIEGVLGHEIAHIANGDMVRMALLQGVLTSLISPVANTVAWLVVVGMNRQRRGPARVFVVGVVQIILGFLGVLVVYGESRWREFRADREGATLAGRPNMLASLYSLQSHIIMGDTRSPHLATLKISGESGGWARVLRTHPSLEERIVALQQGR